MTPGGSVVTYAKSTGAHANDMQMTTFYLATFEVFRPLSATKVGGSRDCRPPIAANRFVIFDRNKMAAVTNSLKLINEARGKKEEDRVMRTSPLISHLIDSSIFNQPNTTLSFSAIKFPV